MRGSDLEQAKAIFTVEGGLDTVDRSTRSRIMRAVKGKDTQLELKVRRLVHAMGYRFRLHRRDLPGSPDLTFARLGAIIFVHGCFFHQHPGCRYGRMPKSNLEFWRPKLRRNVERDAHAVAELRSAGWRVLTVWECELAQDGKLRRRLKGFLERASVSRGARRFGK